MSLTERVLCFMACPDPEHDRVSQWVERNPWAVAVLVAAGFLLAGAVDGGAI